MKAQLVLALVTLWSRLDRIVDSHGGRRNYVTAAPLLLCSIDSHDLIKIYTFISLFLLCLGRGLCAARRAQGRASRLTRGMRRLVAAALLAAAANIHVAAVVANTRVALLLVGGFSGTNSTASSLERAIVRPLIEAGYTVDAHVTHPSEQTDLWRAWLAKVGGLGARELTPAGPIGPWNESHYSHDCNPWHTSEKHPHYHEHSALIEQNWNLLLKYESTSGIQYECVLHFITVSLAP